MKYYSTQRPVMPGSYPKPQGNPVTEIVNYDERTFCEELGREVWGYIEYEKPLPRYDSDSYELTPLSQDTPEELTKWLNKELYERMFAEQKAYQEWLLNQPQTEILDHAYEYTVRADILMACEYNLLPADQAKALLKSPSPLADIFADWEKKETDYMADLWRTVEARAKAEAEKRQKEDHAKNVSPREPAGPGSIVCMPLRRNVPQCIENGVLAKCPKCGEDCWRSPMVDRFERRGAVALCTQCALKKGAVRRG